MNDRNITYTYATGGAMGGRAGGFLCTWGRTRAKRRRRERRLDVEHVQRFNKNDKRRRKTKREMCSSRKAEKRKKRNDAPPTQSPRNRSCAFVFPFTLVFTPSRLFWLIASLGRTHAHTLPTSLFPNPKQLPPVSSPPAAAVAPIEIAPVVRVPAADPGLGPLEQLSDEGHVAEEGEEEGEHVAVCGVGCNRVGYELIGSSVPLESTPPDDPRHN